MSKSKAYYQVKVKDEQKIIEGYLFVYDSKDNVAHKKDDPIVVVNPYTKMMEECKVCNVLECEDPRTGQNGTMVKFISK